MIIDPKLRDEFNEHYVLWCHDTQMTSSMTLIMEHPSYLALEKMGPVILPLIFEKMRQEYGFWFDLLPKLAGFDLVGHDMRGQIESMTKTWLRWADENHDGAIIACRDEIARNDAENKPTSLPGYHIDKISKGEFGKISKIREELEELEDAAKQDSRILQLVELSDLYGALEGYAESLGMSMDEIIKMSSITKRAFKNGKRSPKQA